MKIRYLVVLVLVAIVGVFCIYERSPDRNDNQWSVFNDMFVEMGMIGICIVIVTVFMSPIIRSIL